MISPLGTAIVAARSSGAPGAMPPLGGHPQARYVPTFSIVTSITRWNCRASPTNRFHPHLQLIARDLCAGFCNELRKAKLGAHSFRTTFSINRRIAGFALSAEYAANVSQKPARRALRIVTWCPKRSVPRPWRRDPSGTREFPCLH